jgi:hypothetical protein
MLAAWVDYVSEQDGLQDPLSSAIGTANRSRGLERVAALLSLVSPQLGNDAKIVSVVEGLCGTFTDTIATPAHLIPGRNS